MQKKRAVKIVLILAFFVFLGLSFLLFTTLNPGITGSVVKDVNKFKVLSQESESEIEQTVSSNSVSSDLNSNSDSYYTPRSSSSHSSRSRSSSSSSSSSGSSNTNPLNSQENSDSSSLLSQSLPPEFFIDNESSEDEAQISSSQDQIIERNGTKYIIRDGKEYILSTATSTYYIEFYPSLPSSLCGSERIDITVKGNLRLSLSDEEAADCSADILFPPYNHWVSFDLYLMEADLWPNPDDRIAAIYTSGYTSNCISVDLGYLGKTFEDIDLSAQAGGTEGNTIEVYATATNNVVDISTSSYDVYNYISGECQCLSGACCYTGSRPYQFKLSGSQPIGYTDEYSCSGTNSPTGTNYVVKRDYYCNGQDASAHYSDSNYDTCGTCEYCTTGDPSCNYYDTSTTCGTFDCSSLDTACRKYNDLNEYCNGGGTCEAVDSCYDSYTNEPDGTSCGTNSECDGNGNCITCTSRSSYTCNDNDVYWYDACGNRQEKKQECGSNYCETTSTYFCKNDDIWTRRNCYNKGCFNNACYSDSFVTEEFFLDCPYGCESGDCKPNPNIECNRDLDCGTDGYIGNPFCGDNGWPYYLGYRYQTYRDYTCVNPGTEQSYCDTDYTSVSLEFCGGGPDCTSWDDPDCYNYCDAWGSNYCRDNDAYHSRTCDERGCSSGACFHNTNVEEVKVNECGAAGCSNGQCLGPVCSQNSDCGTNGWIGSPSCSNNDVFQNWRTYTCNNPGQQNSYCSQIDENKLKQDCGEDSYGNNYCYDNDVYRDFTDKGCSSGNCFATTTRQKVQECSTAGCSNNNCNLIERINLNAGTNMFSLPLKKEGGISYTETNSNCHIVAGGVNSLCSGANLAYWDPQQDKYVCLDVNSKLYAGQGYFVKVEGDCYIEITGSEFGVVGNIGFLGSGNLYSGFNLIGASSDETDIHNVVGNCNIVSWPQTFAYGATSCGNVEGYEGGFAYCSTSPNLIPYCYCEVSILKPGKGYWTETSNDCNLS